MARYKVSYRVLRQQGEDMKAVAKMVDGYADRVGRIRGQLGSDNMLAEIRNNLQRLGAQLGESRAILNTAGELLVKNVESYGGVELRQVKKVDSMKAHNRDFYKKPIVVASAGGGSGGAGAGAGTAGAAAGAGSGAATTTTTTNTVNYTDNSVNVTNYAAPEPAAGGAAQAGAAAGGGMAGIPSQGGPVNAAAGQATPPAPQPVSSAPSSGGAAPAPAAAGAAGAATPGAALRESANAAAGSVGPGAAAGVAAGAVTAGGILGGAEIKKRRDANKESGETDAPPPPAEDAYDPEAELEKALEKVRNLADN